MLLVDRAEKQRRTEIGPAPGQKQLRARRPALSRVQRRALTQLKNDPNPGNAHTVQAMPKMDKIIIADLKKVYESA
jgi:hypothetical protein